MYLFRGLLLIVFQFLTAIRSYDVIQENLISEVPVKNETVHASSIKYVTSYGFPTTCCQSATFSVVFDDLFPVGDCMHLTFEDLDLPPNASLMVIEASKGSRAILMDFSSHPSHKPKDASSIYLCDTIRTCNKNSTLWVLLKYEGSPLLPHIGFRARAWSTSLKNSPDAINMSNDNSSPAVPCQVLTMINSGQEVRQRIITKEAVLDYVWVVKPPTDLNALNNFLVFIRIISAQFDGDLEVREGVASDASVLMQKSVTSSEKSLAHTTLSSERGFHIRLRVPPNVSSAQFHFVTGVHRISNVDTDEDNWIACHNSSWMILNRYRCDNIQHCPMGEDEDIAICIVTLSPASSTESVSFLKWLIPLIAGFVLIGLILSILKLYMKSKYRHQDRCGSTEIHHPVSSAQLPLLRIPSQSQCGSTAGRSSAIYIPPDPRRPTSLGGGLSWLGSNASTPHPGAIRIPMSRNAASAAAIVVRSQVHRDAIANRDGQVHPPSYEEATADVSFGDSSDSLEDLEHLPEYHPPSYEDASQGKMGVSSWVSSSARPILP